MKPSSKPAALVLAAASLLAAGSAFAERPANLANTTWTLLTNREPVQLFIDTQGGPGAPGAANCRGINAVLGVPPPEIKATGWYCPSTGRIHLVHRNLDSKIAVRTFTGNVSDVVEGQPLFMAGVMTVEISEFGDLGEYPFSATQQP